MAEFDSIAGNYRDLVTESVRISGESADYFASYKARYLARLLAGLPLKRILDYGCGVGALAKHLCVEFPAASIDGFDPSVESISRVEKLVRLRGSYVTSLQRLSDAYDLIVLANVLHHVKPEGRQDVFIQAFSMLAHGGRLVVFEHNPFNPLTRWAVSHCEFDRDVILLRSAETISRFKKAGFKIDRKHFIVFFPHGLAFLRAMEPLLRWCPGGAQYAVSGIRPGLDQGERMGVPVKPDRENNISAISR